MKYDHKKIADELDATAKGASYFGNSLYVAMDFPWTTANDRQVLQRYLYGSELLTDRIRLQEIATLARNKGEIPCK